MIMPFEMNHCPHKGDEFVDHIIYYALAHINAKMHMKTKFVNKCTCMRTRSKMTHNRNLCGATYPNDFIPKTKENKFNKIIILTLDMAQTSTTMKTQTKVVFYVDCFNLAPSMVVALSIHALHLFEMSLVV
jgi:hypothetical protein